MANHSYLASDDQNPDFVGAHNPDNTLHVQFFKHAVQNNYKSEQEGRPIYDDIDMVRIQVPGDKLTSIEAIAREDHKRRFPQQWAMFKNQHEGDQVMAGKTPLEAWPRLTKAQVAELRHMRFRSVEDIANASDTQLQAIGMVAGMSSYAFRDVAKRFLDLAAGEAAASKSDERANALQAQVDAQAQEMASLRAMLSQVAAANQAPSLDQLAADNQAADTVDDAPAAPQRRTRSA